MIAVPEEQIDPSIVEAPNARRGSVTPDERDTFAVCDTVRCQQLDVNVWVDLVTQESTGSIAKNGIHPAFVI